MSTQTLAPLEIVRGGIKVTASEAASQSFKRDELVYLVAGKVTVVASAGTVIWAIALADATGVTDADCDVQVDDGTLVLRGNVYHGTVASAVTAVANLGIKYGLYIADNKVHVDISNTSNDAVVITSLDKGEIGDVYGRCNFKLIPAVLQSGAAAT